MFKLFTAAILAIALTGCGITQNRDTLEVAQVRVERVTIPEELLAPCTPNRPMPREQFLAFKPHEREHHLTDYIIGLLGTVRECNSRIEQIRILNAR